VPFSPDVLFVAGLDWEHLKGMALSRPVINLIQHVRHSDPDDPRYEYLWRPAVRICVSNEVADAIQATGRVRGPVVTIPNGVDTSEFPVSRRIEDRPVDVLVCALRQKALGARVVSRLKDRELSVHLLTDHVARPLFLASLADAKIVVVLPDPVEGFCLPALEAMALGALLIVPDVVGNRSFCLGGVNCLMPDFNEDSVVDAVEQAVALTTADSDRLRGEAARMVATHSLDHERAQFHAVLARLDELWATATKTSS
jgi:glycosyltransferase involved in cell wall biosynthesis